jgi:hypothetical protein
MSSLLRDAIGWLAILPPFVGCAVCAMHLGRSRFVPLLLGGFGVHTAVLLFFRLAVFLQTQGQLGSGIQMVYALASLVSLLASAAVVAGVAGLLAESARQPQ